MAAQQLSLSLVCCRRRKIGRSGLVPVASTGLWMRRPRVICSRRAPDWLTRSLRAAMATCWKGVRLQRVHASCRLIGNSAHLPSVQPSQDEQSIFSLRVSVNLAPTRLVRSRGRFWAWPIFEALSNTVVHGLEDARSTYMGLWAFLGPCCCI